MFITRVRVRFHEIDRAGIAYFARSFQYCHETFEDMLARALDVDLERFFRESTWMLPLVHAESDYRMPIVLGQDLRIELKIARVGKTSVHFAYRIIGEPDGVERGKVTLVHSCVERQGFITRPLPDELIAGFKALGLIPPEVRRKD
ncbi:MAG: acyl-CoA thioesterase [Planctomycetes bacterium]|nr:acyl-CoA thioesterase [Planctomycetota bacterium]